MITHFPAKLAVFPDFVREDRVQCREVSSVPCLMSIVYKTGILKMCSCQEGTEKEVMLPSLRVKETFIKSIFKKCSLFLWRDCDL